MPDTVRETRAAVSRLRGDAKLRLAVESCVVSSNPVQNLNTSREAAQAEEKHG
jgi:hypothetical protein